MKKRVPLLFICLLLSLSLMACGNVKDPEIIKFESDIQTFCDNISAIDANINNIDATSETADEELLSYLDQLDQYFKVLAEMSIPDEYAYLKELTTEASEYMSTAVTSYHEAFAGESYDANIADYAYQNYERAYKRVTVMLQLLRGETVTEDAVIIQQGN